MSVPDKQSNTSKWIHRKNATKPQKRALPARMMMNSPAKLTPFEEAHIEQIGPLSVAFPFKPYPCQVAYMTKVKDALINGTNAILESPTGTGKTMCLLSVVLAWQHAILEGRVPNPKVKSFSTGRAKKPPSVEADLIEKLDSLQNISSKRSRIIQII